MATRFSSPTFVGRAVELGLLEDAGRRAAAGPSAVVAVGGEAGVGKTRLIDEFARRARAEGARVLVGACVELGEQGVPFAPVASALRGMLRTMEPEEAQRSIGHGRADLSRLLPELGPSPGGDGQAVGPELARRRAGCSGCCWTWWSGPPASSPPCWWWRTCTGPTSPPGSCSAS